MNTNVTNQSEGLAVEGFSGAVADQHAEFLKRIGQMTRNLHDSLRGLGLDKIIQQAAHEIPNVKDRLEYVSKMSEQAAQRVLNATDAAGPLQDGIEDRGEALRKQWQTMLTGTRSDGQFRKMAERTFRYLDDTRDASIETRKYLLEIMMAQDFQDLTGQVIKKITDLATNLEQQLVQLLLDFAPTEMRRDQGAGLLNGPQINPTGNAEVVANQNQVDDLLESLGF